MFGWIPALWRITDQQVLASAGLDAYVVCFVLRWRAFSSADPPQFLAFFRMAIKCLGVTLFFALVVLKPVHDAFPDDNNLGNHTRNDTSNLFTRVSSPLVTLNFDAARKRPSFADHISTDYLWMYLIFAWLFTGLAIYLLRRETERIIDIRQEYLGNQSTVTDRTIRLSGIPPYLQSEEKIQAFIEQLEIGKVDSVMLCRKWQELDDAMDRRMDLMRKLEEAWTVYLGQRRVERNLETLPIAQPPPPGPDAEQDWDEEDGPLLNPPPNGAAPAVPYARPRPMTTLRYGFLKLRSKPIDAIDYYEEKLRTVDERIKELRKKEFEPMPIAFVTMDSVAACVRVEGDLFQTTTELT